MQLGQSIHVLRFLTFFVSLITFFCHLSQCLLLNKYKEKTGIPDWLIAGHWQYLTWYISLVLSLVGSFAVCVNATYFNRPTKYSIDKCVGSLVIVPILVSILTAFLIDPAEPWTNDRFKLERPPKSLFTSCNVLDASRDKLYPLLYQRCMLNDCTWIFAILLCIIWNCLVIFVMFASRKKRSAMTKDVIQPAVGEELKWGRYIPDPPSSIYSATTLGNRSGLLIPSSTLTREKHSEFYYNCSIPSIATSPTGDYYYSSSYSPVESKGDYSYYSLDHKTTSAYDYFTRRDYDRKYPSSYYHGGGNNQKEEDRRSSSSSSSTSPYSTRQLLTVSTLYHGSSSLPLSEKEPESATIITTPLYNKFSSSNKFNDTFSFGLGSCNNHYT